MEGQGNPPEKSREGDVQSYTLENFDHPRPGRALPPPAGPRTEGEDFKPGIDFASFQPDEFQGGAQETTQELDFASIKFQRENTLLTNAESYAASIREEAQLYVQQLRGEVETLNAEAESRYEEAAHVKEKAEQDAARLIEEGEAKVAEITKKARQEGYDAGLEEGIKRRYEEAQPHLKNLEAILKEIGQFRKRVAYYTEKDGVRLALVIAKKVLNSELKINRKVVLKLVANTLAKLEGKGTFRVWLSEADHEFALKARSSLERFLDEDQALTLRSKPDLEPGNVLVETDREIIDLTFESQFFHLEQQINQSLAEREAVVNQQIRASGATATAPNAASKAPAPQAPSAAQETPPPPGGESGEEEHGG